MRRAIGDFLLRRLQEAGINTFSVFLATTISDSSSNSKTVGSPPGLEIVTSSAQQRTLKNECNQNVRRNQPLILVAVWEPLP